MSPPPRWSAAARSAYNRLIETLAEEAGPDGARRYADLAVADGLWRDPLQRPEHYLPSLPPRPVYDPAGFWFCSYLEENYQRIRAEVDQVTDPARSGFVAADAALVGTGRWEEVTFYEGGHRFAEACARFPVTASVIEGIPEAAAAGIGVVTLSWLHPGTRIRPHCGGTNARLRVHLGLRVPPGARMRVGTESLTWQEGRCLVFDDSFEHEVRHDGELPRVILLMDVCHPALDPVELDLLMAGQGTFEERAAGFLRDRGLRRVERAGGAVRADLDPASARQVVQYLDGQGADSVELRDGRLVLGRAATPGRAPDEPAESDREER
ncbi:aspartate beta-hydroxylase [Micromonospora haikouensis]|uniref:Aspartate beta-hydroxylase n=1 Tax=Micromonospora haikouensis TaxID=686309 RepID=A0A1C4XGW2_9ACTN|nr:aspartyl/asparaginyl beta-hydroxylase domain-containing protein [Micromonospora haikouensis]SCF07809.1 aspartate beta-hydroxylase [Micromonospora haikouensis]